LVLGAEPQPISFPTVLDVYDFCSDELKSTMKISRDKCVGNCVALAVGWSLTIALLGTT
jgi:hypothetical protein